MKMNSERIQFELTRERVEKLDALKVQARLPTRTDLLNNALTILEWALEERAKGRLIVSLDKKRCRELVMPCFTRAAK